ncbi:hypothetical protein [Pseudostreptobacillus hongkongensis]|uniref:hypothetical protein n=1 Tax=Pseudostreptobacillus hongkongensis TaxID=1162717 RepID=UPI000835A436|nr:hypothetical protein [Pseudostreptobacillus hongkongensis]
MDILNFIAIWMYYSKLYILGSLGVTFLLNKFFKDKLYMPPLIINMVSVILLFMIPFKDRAYAMYINYMPVVITSVLLNLSIYLLRRIDDKKNK